MKDKPKIKYKAYGSDCLLKMTAFYTFVNEDSKEKSTLFLWSVLFNLTYFCHNDFSY